MATPGATPDITLTITKYPQNLIIPPYTEDIDNTISFQVTNKSNKSEKITIDFDSENLEIRIPGGLKKETEFQPGESKTIDIIITPVSDGFGKLTVNANYLKLVTYTTNVQSIRDHAPKQKIKKIFKKKKLPKIDTVEPFNPNHMLASMSKGDIKKKVNQLQDKREKYQAQSAQAQLGSAPVTIPEITIEDIDNDIKELAKGYLNNKDTNKALGIALELSNENERLSFYYNLIRAYASVNMDNTLQIIMSLNDDQKKFETLRNVAFDRVAIDPEQAGRIAFLVEDVSLKEKLMINLIIKTIELYPDKALKLTYLIEEITIKINIFFKILEKLFEKNQKTHCLEVTNQIINEILNSPKINLAEKGYKNQFVEYLIDSIRILAEIENPNGANIIIEGLSDQGLKEKIATELFDIIFELKEETKTELQPVVAASQYYLFNTYISNLNESIKDFSLIGGNISNNLLLNDFNFNVVFISLFKFDFSIFPTLDRVYSDLKINLNKSIAYYIYPSIDQHRASELSIINNTLNQFLISKLDNSPGQVFIFNLDFIPYLGKPTIIISSESELYNYINNKIGTLGDSVNFIIDNEFFEGGKVMENLKQQFPPNKCKIVNLILSYEFINDYDIFKAFIQALL